MKNKSFKLIVPALLLSLLSLQMQSCKGENKDAGIQTSIASKTTTDPNLAAVSATVVEGTVTLTGQCKDDGSRQRAEKVVKDIDGVKKVINNIVVTPTIVVASDKDLKEGVQHVMSDYRNVRADVSNGIITLRGEIRQNKVQQLMMNLNALRPKRIDNELLIK